MKHQIAVALLSWLGGGLLGAHAAAPSAAAADMIYTGGDIVTINDKQPSAQALAVKDGKILALGERKSIEAQHKGAKT
jgi:hypothetical protein